MHFFMTWSYDSHDHVGGLLVGIHEFGNVPLVMVLVILPNLVAWRAQILEDKDGLNKLYS